MDSDLDFERSDKDVEILSVGKHGGGHWEINVSAESSDFHRKGRYLYRKGRYYVCYLHGETDVLDEDRPAFVVMKLDDLAL
jgi:hypothetical protein